MTIAEKVSYLKGLMEGMSLDQSKPETKLFQTLADIVADVALELEDLQEQVLTAHDYCEELDEDLGDVESYLFEDDEDEYDDCDCDCDDCDCDCDDCDCDCDEDEEPMFAVECSECGDDVYFDDTVDVSNLKCPGCGAKIEIEEIKD